MYLFVKYSHITLIFWPPWGISTHIYVEAMAIIDLLNGLVFTRLQVTIATSWALVKWLIELG